uniref:ANK_REP_REGION domain-containing protein n=1 Tax=Mesocestoides corti TaxID=53468 RepID=A0A5K3EW66_MESCO
MADCLLHDAPDIIQAIFIGDKSMLQFPPSTDDVNYRDSHRRTPLHAAAYCGEAEVVEFLLKHNARVNVKDAKWYTPLHRACASNASSVVKLLLENGADRNVREKCWLTPLHVAAINGSLECARLLLLHSSGEGGSGANVNASDRGGHTPLHHAVYGGHYELVRLLLSNGASVNAFDKNDRRAMHWAASCDLISRKKSYPQIKKVLELFWHASCYIINVCVVPTHESCALLFVMWDVPKYQNFFY